MIDKTIYLAGAKCRINTQGDVFMMRDAKPFMSELGVVVRETKAGLIQVSLLSDSRKTHSFPKRNVDLL